MKSVFGILTVLVFPFISNGQKIATTFQNATKNQGIRIEQLDSTYQSALNDDSTKAVFMGQEKEFYEGYVSMLQALGKHLTANNFKWDKTTRCFNRIYFNKDGEIDYFLFNFYPGQIEPDKEKEFEKHLSSFVESYTFPLTAKKDFAQCSPVTYQAKAKN